MLSIRNIKKSVLSETLRVQLQTNYFPLEDIHLLKILPIKTGILLFYYTHNLPFSLGMCLLDKQCKCIRGKSIFPIWRSNESIEVRKIRKNSQKILFDFAINRQLHTIHFAIEDLLNNLSFNILNKAAQNPILKPNPLSVWESVSVFNPAVLYLDNKVHFIYRAIGDHGQSVLGYAASKDGFNIDERFPHPVFPLSDLYIHNHPAQKSSYTSGGNCCGCEDPRLVHIGDRIYMTYTAFDGHNAPCIHLSSISVTDFLQRQWQWTTPTRISPAGEMHKNWVIFPQLLQNRYAILHSITPDVQIDYFDSLNFNHSPIIKSQYRVTQRKEHWDSWVRGVGPVPIAIPEGWLVLYHAMDHQDPNRYKLGGMILDRKDPTRILYRANVPLLEPNEPYENNGCKSGVIYACGAIVKGKQLLVYYGGADTVVCVAFANLQEVLRQIKHGSVGAKYVVNPQH